MYPIIRITQESQNILQFSAQVDFGNGRRSKIHEIFKSEKQAVVYMKRIYDLPKDTKVVRSFRNTK